MHVANIESMSTPSMTYCVVINIQIILIRVVQRAQSKTTYEPILAIANPKLTTGHTRKSWSLSALCFLFMGPQAHTKSQHPGMSKSMEIIFIRYDNHWCTIFQHIGVFLGLLIHVRSSSIWVMPVLNLTLLPCHSQTYTLTRSSLAIHLLKDTSSVNPSVQVP